MITSVGVLMFCAKRCGDHFAKFSRASLLVAGSAEFPIREPQLLGRQRHGLEVEHAVVRDGDLEAVGVADQPVHGIAAVAGAGNPLSRRIDERQLRHRVEDGVEIAHHLPAPVPGDLVDELLAEAERAARIGRRDDPALAPPRATDSSGTTTRRPTRPADRRESGRRLDTSSWRSKPGGFRIQVLHRRAAGAV